MSVTLLWVLVGLAGRIVLPYLVSVLQSEGPLSFEFRYVIGQVLGNIVAYIPVLFDPTYLNTLDGLLPVLAIGIGWGFSDMGREVQKTVVALYNMRKG